MSAAAGARRRRAGSERRSDHFVQSDWRQLFNTYPKTRVVSDDEIGGVHRASLKILEEVGLNILNAEALAVLKSAGARVDEFRVRLGREIVETALATVPSAITLTPRNPDRAVRLGGDAFAIAAVLGPPYCSDIDRGRRSGSLADFEAFLKLTQYFNIIHLNGSPVEALDCEVRFRHLDMAFAMLTLTDKVPYVYCQSRQRIEDVLSMAAMARGESLEQFARRPGIFSIINTNSPLQYDTPMATGVMDMARHGQPVLITPFTLSGATTPATLGGGAVLANVEILLGVVLSQLVRPGAPVFYGAHIKNVDLKTGAPAYGLPDSFKGNQIAGQLARRYRMPFRSSNFSASNAPDAAAGLQSQGSVFSAVMGGANLLMHGAGWLEGGLCASFEKFVIDVEILQCMAHYLEPVRLDIDALALDEIADVGPGGHFFGTPRTVATFETAFYQPLLSTTQNYGAWMEAGGRDAAQRANAIWKQAIEDYWKPPMDPAIREQLAAFVARRKEKGGAPLD